MKKIIINADDYGLCDSISEGIIHCLKFGIVSDLSFIVNKDNIENSIFLLRKNNIEHIGIHFNFTLNKPISDNLSSLTNSDGFFLDLKSHFLNYLKKKIDIDQIYQEAKAQIEILISAGFRISHFDTHQNIHILPPFYKIIEKIRKEYNPKAYIRVPYERKFLSKSIKFSNLCRILILNSLSKILLIKYNIRNTVQTIGGDFFNNKYPKEVFKRIVKKIDESTINHFEIATHPGFISNEIRKFDSYIEGREVELQYLSVPNDLLVENKIKLVSFVELMEE